MKLAYVNVDRLKVRPVLKAGISIGRLLLEANQAGNNSIVFYSTFLIIPLDGILVSYEYQPVSSYILNVPFIILSKNFVLFS